MKGLKIKAAINEIENRKRKSTKLKCESLKRPTKLTNFILAKDIQITKERRDILLTVQK